MIGSNSILQSTYIFSTSGEESIFVSPKTYSPPNIKGNSVEVCNKLYLTQIKFLNYNNDVKNNIYTLECLYDFGTYYLRKNINILDGKQYEGEIYKILSPSYFCEFYNDELYLHIGNESELVLKLGLSGGKINKILRIDYNGKNIVDLLFKTSYILSDYNRLTSLFGKDLENKDLIEFNLYDIDLSFAGKYSVYFKELSIITSKNYVTLGMNINIKHEKIFRTECYLDILFYDSRYIVFSGRLGSIIMDNKIGKFWFTTKLKKISFVGSKGEISCGYILHLNNDGSIYIEKLEYKIYDNILETDVGYEHVMYLGNNRWILCNNFIGFYVGAIYTENPSKHLYSNYILNYWIENTKTIVMPIENENERKYNYSKINYYIAPIFSYILKIY